MMENLRQEEENITKDISSLFKLRKKLNYTAINPIQDGSFWGCSRMGVGGWGGEQKVPPLPKICHTYPIMMKLDILIPYLTKNQKKYIDHVTHPLSSADISIFFAGNQQILLYQEIQI